MKNVPSSAADILASSFSLSLYVSYKFIVCTHIHAKKRVYIYIYVCVGVGGEGEEVRSQINDFGQRCLRQKKG